MDTYFNTNKECGAVLANSSSDALNQQRIILDKFREAAVYNGVYYSPDYIHKYWFGYRYPITSIRRALTNLTKAGFLDKTDNMVIGSYGKMVHTWRLAQHDKQLPLL